jgi:eukaryotic-like serine/threonine-protein kinase
MAHCPSEDQLTGLLAGTLASTEQDALVRHVEKCATCQSQLAKFSEFLIPEMKRGSVESTVSEEAEEAALQRLKSTRPSSAQHPESAHTTLGNLSQAELAASAAADPHWPIVLGYEIIGVLGRGGMAVVYKARHLALQRIVALKMLRDWARASEKELARFRKEADVIARLQHPNIVQIYSVGEVSGRPYFVLEYVVGGSLALQLHGDPQSARSAAQFVEVLARAVQAAHASGIIHRDLKPSNILLVPVELNAADSSDQTLDRNSIFPNGVLKAVPKIADFGVAKRASENWEDQLQRSLTVTGDLIGTPSYMAPEQASPAGQPVGPTVDVYALGAILYELLTGRPPFKGEMPLDTILQVIHNEPVAVTSLQPNVPNDLETICHKCLQKDSRHRYQTADELADDLRSFLRGRPIKARPRSAVEKVWRWIRAHPVSSGLLAAGIFTPVLALFILSLLSARLVRSSALESAVQQAEVMEEANNQYSQIVQRVEQAKYPINKMVPPTPDTVPLSIPATFLHDVGEGLRQNTKTGIQVRQFSDFPFPWRVDGGPHDDFEREALQRLRASNGKDTLHSFTEMDGEPVVRYAQARIMKQSCVDCHNTHPLSAKHDWKEGDVRGVLEIIRPLKNDEGRVTQALQLTLLLSAIGSGLLFFGSVIAIWTKRRQIARRST